MKTFQISIIALSILSAAVNLHSQGFESYTFDPPRFLDPLNSQEHEEAAPLISPDKSRVYFTRTRNMIQFDKPVSIHEIWFSDYLEDSWTEAVRAFHPLNDNQNTAVIGFKEDGLYLFGVYASSLRNLNGASETHIQNGAWTNPAQLPIPDLEIKGEFYGLSMHESEKVLLISKGISGNEDLYVTLKDTQGNWSDLINLGSTINSTGYEIAPYLSPDSHYLFFSRGNSEKDADIFVSRRIDNSWQKWTEPERLPEPINSDQFDAYFSINSDSTVLFSSDRLGSNDIYQSRLRVKATLPNNVELSEFEVIPVISKEEIPEPETTQIIRRAQINEADGYVFFAFNQSSLSTPTKNTLDSIVERMHNEPSLTLEVAGHADYIDSEDFNMELSTRRSQHVADYLISKGIDASRISTTAFGELLPISNNETEMGRRLNRRVEIYFKTESKTETTPNDQAISAKNGPSDKSQSTVGKEVAVINKN